MFFDTVVTSMSKDQFLSTVFNKEHHFFASSNRLAGKLTVDDLDAYLNQWAGSLHTFVYASLHGEQVQTSQDEFNVLSQKAQFVDLYRRGATLKIDGFEIRHPTIAQLCRDLEMMLGGRTFAKGFLTPVGVNGFGVHFDAYDTFVMQLEGEKHWQVWAPLVTAPGEEMARQVKPEELGEPLAEYILKPGDVLYMPSGYPHCARCTDTHSFHITVGFNPWRADKVIQFLLRTLAVENDSIRQFVFPSEVDPDAESRLKIALMDFAVALERVKTSELLALYRAAHNATMPSVLDRSLRTSSLLPTATPAARFEFDSKALHGLDIESDDERVLVRIGCSIPPSHPLHFHPPRIELPAYVEPDLRSIFSMKRPFTAAEVEGNLDLDSKHVLLGELARQGVLSLTAP